MARTRDELLGRLLVDGGALTAGALSSALDEQRRSGRALGEILLRKGLVDEVEVAKALAAQLGLAYVAPPLAPDPRALKKVEPGLARAKGILPLSLEGRRLTVAMADPLATEVIDELRFRSGCHVEAVVAPPSAVAQAVRDAYGGELPELLDRLGSRTAPKAPGDLRVLEQEASAAPIVRIVDHLISTAIDRRASDIHIETLGAGSRVRLRVDGRLATATELPPGTHSAAISRVKIMAGLDISVRRRPQDGGFTVRHGNAELTVRVSTIPTHLGEKAVLRLLDPGDAPADLSALGLSSGDLDRLRQVLARRQGALLAAGPTGCGKTTTLSAAVAELAGAKINIVTLEDPIEYRFPGVAQMEIDNKAGVDFPCDPAAGPRRDPGWGDSRPGDCGDRDVGGGDRPPRADDDSHGGRSERGGAAPRNRGAALSRGGRAGRGGRPAAGAQAVFAVRGPRGRPLHRLLQRLPGPKRRLRGPDGRRRPAHGHQRGLVADLAAHPGAPGRDGFDGP